MGSLVLASDLEERAYWLLDASICISGSVSRNNPVPMAQAPVEEPGNKVENG